MHPINHFLATRNGFLVTRNGFLVTRNPSLLTSLFPVKKVALWRGWAGLGEFSGHQKYSNAPFLATRNAAMPHSLATRIQAWVIGPNKSFLLGI
jgi:hypothetical protein